VRLLLQGGLLPAYGMQQQQQQQYPSNPTYAPPMAQAAPMVQAMPIAQPNGGTLDVTVPEGGHLFG
jgi:hypothetical protein